ncbi:MAG: hypothetical protein F4W95_11175 [Chloroflexi bacterium]|nr:hypothetical protein [Chloroflexota bacterium]MYD49030.1 hypothetical protein [Chloroflexota bacterium]
MEPLTWQETVTYLGLIVTWYAGITAFYNLQLRWVIYPWTLLCAAFLLFIWYALPLLDPFLPPAAIPTMVGIFIAIDMLIPVGVGWIMFRHGGKWKKPGLLLMAIAFASTIGWLSFVIYAAAAGMIAKIL